MATYDLSPTGVKTSKNSNKLTLIFGNYSLPGPKNGESEPFTGPDLTIPKMGVFLRQDLRKVCSTGGYY